MSPFVFVQVGGAALLLGYLVLATARTEIAGRIGWLVFQRGDFEGARRLLARTRRFLPTEWNERTEASYLEYTGQTVEALAWAERAAVVSRGVHANQCVNILINAGRYSKALEVGRRHERSWRAERELLQVNLAEAEYNLGQREQALIRLKKTELVTLIARAGCGAQVAWILARQGRPLEAREALNAAVPLDLPQIFLAEYHYTDAVVCLAEGKPGLGLQAVETGRTLACRASSIRNGLFLRARIYERLDETDLALADFEAASQLPYRHQGGDGLLAWGDLLERLGRHEEARRAWSLAVERDGESESARTAAARLAATQS